MKVASHAVGSVLINQVTPKVDSFSPDLIILSAGFDAHKNDPMCLGALSADDFGHITELACHLAFKSCSGRLVSVLEGGYGVPCCRLQKDLFLPQPTRKSTSPIPAAPPTNNPSSTTPLPSEEPTTTAVSQVAAPHSSSVAPQKPDLHIPSLTGAPPESVTPAVITEKQEHDQQQEEGKKEQSPQQQPPPQPQQGQQRLRPQPSKLLDLGADLPADMDDQVPYTLQRRVEKCHVEGFLHCVKEHVASLGKCNVRK